MRQRVEALEARYGLDHLAHRSRQLVIGSYVVLLALLGFGALRVQEYTDNGILPLLVRLVPLVLFLPSIMTRRPRGHAWLAFVSLLYFMQGVMVTTLPGFGITGVLESLAAIGLFLGSTGFARFRSRQLKRG
ncbi:DUF2069 domain-containing protein [Aidingimonas lacisalsi]|uniref:DUF2069 domain-containing protein n=1 Tax=Aidingimonas lacisalsi TaxID=2604086 RepID=UPI0011D25681|nr:DUF2069 domain-containing protein [Aidingimonas lacisalsi]